MISRILLSSLILASVILPVIGQQPQPGASPQPQTAVPNQQPSPDVESQDVVRINTNLVQVDVVVTKDGKPVNDLQPGDFEILEDGKPQTITNFSYISNVPDGATAATAPRQKPSEKTAPPVPPAKIKLGDQRRTVALVIDDLGISWDSMSQIKSQVRKFLDQLSPNDLVAIIRTGGDIGSLQQFTNDRRLLQSSVDHLRWNPCSRSGLHVFQAAGALGDNTNICSQYVLNGTVKALKFILKGMSDLPGRKSMVLFSDFLPIEDQESPLFGRANQTGDGSEPDSDSAVSDNISYSAQLQRIAELAIRSSVVIYSVDTRGLQYTGPTAADRMSASARNMSGELNSLMRSRSRLLARGREGSDLIARQSGGFLVRNTNDFGLKDIMKDQEGYYLIGFRPAEETFDKKFHHLKARLKRGSMTIRTRAGFYGFTDEETQPTGLTATDAMNKALISPFGAKELDVRLTSFFVDDPTRGALLRSFVYIDPRNLTFADQADGWKLATLDVRAMLFGDNGRKLGEEAQTGRLRLRGAGYETAMREGMTYSFDVPLKLRGPFQFRVAVRDTVTSRIGAAGQFVEIPELKTGRLALSGVVAREEENNSVAAPTNDQNQAVTSGPAVRRFRLGSNASFAFVIYNAGAASQAGQLTQQVRLFREGKVVFTGAPTQVVINGQADSQRIASGSRLQLGAPLTPGDYVFQVIVTDTSDKQKPRMVTQWIDFELTDRKAER
jgi:VWFA-related protein